MVIFVSPKKSHKIPGICSTIFWGRLESRSSFYKAWRWWQVLLATFATEVLLGILLAACGNILPTLPVPQQLATFAKTSATARFTNCLAGSFQVHGTAGFTVWEANVTTRRSATAWVTQPLAATRRISRFMCWRWTLPARPPRDTTIRTAGLYPNYSDLTRGHPQEVA